MLHTHTYGRRSLPSIAWRFLALLVWFVVAPTTLPNTLFLELFHKNFSFWWVGSKQRKCNACNRPQSAWNVCVRRWPTENVTHGTKGKRIRLVNWSILTSISIHWYTTMTVKRNWWTSVIYSVFTEVEVGMCVQKKLRRIRLESVCCVDWNSKRMFESMRCLGETNSWRIHSDFDLRIFESCKVLEMCLPNADFAYLTLRFGRHMWLQLLPDQLHCFIIIRTEDLVTKMVRNGSVFEISYDFHLYAISNSWYDDG